MILPDIDLICFFSGQGRYRGALGIVLTCPLASVVIINNNCSLNSRNIQPFDIINPMLVGHSLAC